MRKCINIIAIITVLLLSAIGAEAQGIAVHLKDGSSKRIPYIVLDSIMTSSSDTPNVSIKKTDGTMLTFRHNEIDSIYTYTSESGKIDGHEYVDLGLPSGTLWATCNIGASKPEDCGNFYSWGEVKVKDYHYNQYYYKWGYGKIHVTKYCVDSYNGIIDNLTELEPADDAATQVWGNNWQIPSHDQIIELCDSNYTTAVFTTYNGVKGELITSKSNNNHIFLPARGYCIDGNFKAGVSGYYWSRSLDTGWTGSFRAWTLLFSLSEIKDERLHRYMGMTVRPVRKF